MSTTTHDQSTESRWAKWWKIDFHAHSPASFDFGADEGSVSENRPSLRSWLQAYMVAEIDALVITDHNSHSGIDAAREALAEIENERPEWYRKIFLFSGVELTVQGGFHLLGMFDVDTPAETINGLLHTCKFTSERGHSLGTTGLSIQEASNEIVSLGGLAIPAHADGPKGVFAYDARNQKDLWESGLISAIEITGDSGLDRAKKLGFIPVLGSDAHHLDGEGCPADRVAKYPGSHFTWLKMQIPNLAGVKLALSDGLQSVVRATAASELPYSISHCTIDEVVLTNGGAQERYEFGPWMNAVIGGRGVGKSTLVEIIRLAMGRHMDLPEVLRGDDHWFSPNRPSRSIARFWNESTQIEILLSRDDENYKVIWKGENPQDSTVQRLVDGEWKSEGGDPRDRFSLLINSQKQIYETARDPQSLLRTIDSQTEVKYKEWENTFQELSGRYRGLRGELRTLNTKISKKDLLTGEIADIDAKLRQIKKLYDSAEAKELNSLTQLQARQEKYTNNVENFKQKLVDLLVEFNFLAEPEADSHQFDSDSSESFQLSFSVREEISKLKASLTNLSTYLDNSRTSPETTQRLEKIQQLKVALSGVFERSDNPSLPSVTELTALTVLREGKQTELQEIERAVVRIASLSVEIQEEVRNIRSHREHLTNLRTQQAVRLSNSNVRLTIVGQGNDTEIEAQLRSLLQKQTAFDQSFSESGLRKVLVHRDHPKFGLSVDSLKSFVLELNNCGADSPIYARSDINFDQRFLTHVSGLDKHELETEINLWFPEDRLKFQFKQDGESKFSNIDEGSPGEKTAALLAVMIQLSDEPLILDQPEDDLDNKLIYELVVSTLKRMKSKRQVITVTHNANVVVNADAEHVTVLKHGRIPTIECSGSMQSTEMKEAICLIMEGGERAFQSRYTRLLPR